MATIKRSFIFASLLELFALLFASTTAQDYTGKLRFVNSTHTYSTAGRLEIYLNGEWGTVCDNGFGRDEAILACNQLGYETYEEFGTVGSLGYPTAFSSRILVSNLACDTSNPNHLTLYHCPRSSGIFCSHTEDVALVCSTPYSTGSSAVRFVSKREKLFSYLTAGRVEIFFSGRWGSVCSDGFTASDARGLCHVITGSDDVLAYGPVGSDNLEFDQASTSRPVWVENLNCRYSSSFSRYYCGHNGIGITNCTHSKDLALSCLADGATRLVTQRYPSHTDPGQNAGRLEIFYNGQWGTVCDDLFSSAEADIVCKQLGYTRADRYGNVQDLVGYGEGTGRIWLDDVRCNSTDVFLANCSHRGFGVENCAHTEDVAISCSLSEHNQGNLRFINSSYIFSSAGRLEIYLNGHWGTICSVGFGPEDATLACNQLGYRTYQRYGTVQQLSYPMGATTTPIHVSNLSCDTFNQSHLTIYHCPRTTGTSCTHSQDVALICASPYANSSSAVRLVSRNGGLSKSLTAGRVEIFFAGRWGSICSDKFTLSDAMGLCHILTRSSSVLAYGSTGSNNLEFEQGSNSTPVWIQNMHCTYHSIDRRYYCDWDGLGITNCTHNKDLALSCRANGAVRLISGSPSSTTDPGGSAGRLEMYYTGRWLSVCDAGFGQSEADVVCHQLGYEGANQYGNVDSLGYSKGSSTTWLSDIQCSSSDVVLTSCFPSGFSTVSNCNSGQEVAVACTANGAVRLISGSPSSTADPGGFAGRLEMYYTGRWLSVCDAGFGQSEADVVCHQLGYEGANQYGNVESLGYSKGSSTTWLSDIQCSSSDVVLTSCFPSGFSTVSNCISGQEVGVTCTTTTTKNTQTALSLSTGAIAGIAIGSIVTISLLCIVAIAVIICFRKKSTNSHNTQTMSAGPALNTNQCDNQHYQPSAPAPTANDKATDPPPTYDQGYPYQYHGQGYEMKQPQYPAQYSMYPQYPPPPHPAATDYPQPYGYPCVGEPNKYYPSLQQHKF